MTGVLTASVFPFRLKEELKRQEEQRRSLEALRRQHEEEAQRLEEERRKIMEEQMRRQEEMRRIEEEKARKEEEQKKLKVRVLTNVYLQNPYFPSIVGVYNRCVVGECKEFNAESSSGPANE